MFNCITVLIKWNGANNSTENSFCLFQFINPNPAEKRK